MDVKFNTLLSIAIIPSAVALIIEKSGLDDVTAIKEFYNSQTYEALAREETKVWHYSPLTIYEMWKHENETGELEYPEEV